MQTGTPIPRPTGAAYAQRVNCAMDIILHIGAHRTGTASFQDYLRRHVGELSARQIACYEPVRAKDGSSTQGLAMGDMKAQVSVSVQSQMDQARQKGMQSMLLSDADMLGTLAQNVEKRSLYPAAGVGLKRLAAALDIEISTVLVSIRSLELYWCSALAHGISQGLEVPERDALAQIAHATRGWRDVITDISDALPQTKIAVLPFEKFIGRPDAVLARGAGLDAPFDTERSWLNRMPTLPDLRRVLNDRGAASADLPFGMGRWNPFTNEEHAALREVYADDMMWLTAGADGRATLIEDRHPERAGSTLPRLTQNKGQQDELDKRQLARPG
ncbi:hypothetical protein [Roseobacter sp. OBYS 0001]|uniref:hypothetical protein n=1 Tax=Roseobacter sp. OBYS 0001 TaxID=882651 RepID=UPI0021803A64|nr:hypothetical protein [Roseobacter sp. OBYS 0001]